MKNILVRCLVVTYIFFGGYAFAECNKAVSIEEQQKCIEEESESNTESESGVAASTRGLFVFADEIKPGVMVQWCLDGETYVIVDCDDYRSSN